MRLFALTFAAALHLDAAAWSGRLVDADCYAGLERNIGPRDTLMNVNRDRDWEIRYCLPTGKTKSFTLVDHDGQSYKLDAAGNAQAIEFVRKATKQVYIPVTVVGEETALRGRAGVKTIEVNSIVRSR